MAEARLQGASESSASGATARSGAAKAAVLPDPVYEFSAPHYYDFATDSTDLPSSERADAWFDTAGTTCKHLLGFIESALAGKAIFGTVCNAALTSPSANKVAQQCHNQTNEEPSGAGQQSEPAKMVSPEI